MHVWLILVIVVAVLVVGFVKVTGRHPAPCIVKTRTSLCPDDTPGLLADEDEIEPEPVGLTPNVSMPFTGHHILGEPAVNRLRSRVWYDSPLVNPLLPLDADGTPAPVLASRILSA